MWQPVKAIILTAASVAAVPYAVALLANILYGWPLGSNRYRRALHPFKVLSLNYAILLQLTRVRYLSLALRWRQFYHNAQANQLIRNLPYGTNGNSVDVYLPPNTRSPRPVTVFVYGGTWGSGDKSMYGLLCSELARSLSSVVLCPNYSIYPKGFVDDMIQDISDVIAFIHENAESFNGDKNRVILIGHSAGAHLAVMTVLELTLKRLNEKPEIFTQLTADNEEREIRRFLVSHVDGCTSDTVVTPAKLQELNTFDESLHELNTNTERLANPSTAVNDKSVESITNATVSQSESVNEQSTLESSLAADQSVVVIDSTDETVQESFYIIDDSQVNESCGDEKESEPRDIHETDVNESEFRAIEVSQQLQDSIVALDTTSAVSQPSTQVDLSANKQQQTDLLSSVQLVIGLAGVYDIGIHYEYETFRGVEDISTMARAMYGTKMFERFSPTVIIRSLPSSVRLPAIHLIHGNVDRTVPEMQSRQFGEAVCNHTLGRISETVIVGCGHTDVCLDLMDPTRQWHYAVKREIIHAFNCVSNTQ